MRPHPRPEPRRPEPRPVHEPRGKHQGSEGRPEGAGSHGQQGEADGPPGKQKPHTGGNNGSAGPLHQQGLPYGHDPGTGNEGGHVPTTVGKGSEGAGYEETTPNAPASGIRPVAETGQLPDRRPAPALLAGQESDSGTSSTEEPSRLPAEAAGDTSAPLSMAVRKEEPVKLAGASSGLPDHQVVAPSRTVDPVAAAPGGGERRSVGNGARPAAGTPFGSTEFFFSYLWDEGSFPAKHAQAGFGSVRDGARDFVAGKPHGGSLTQRESPLQIPSPFSGFGLMMGGAAYGASSSGVGVGPLLAVIFCCLFAVLWRGRSRAYGALLRAGTVPRLALERPG